MASFEVQTTDRTTGVESWTAVTASTADEARKRAAETGMQVGAVRLKSTDDNAQTHDSARTAAAAARGAICPTCGGSTIPRGKGLHSSHETLTCVVLLLFGIIPGVIYYAVVDSRPFCAECRNRV